MVFSALGNMVIFLSGERVCLSKLPFFVNTIFPFCRIIFFILLFSFLPNTGSNTEQSIAIRSNQKNLLKPIRVFLPELRRGQGGTDKRTRRV